MSGSDSHRIPPNRVALSLVLLLIAWLVFSFHPGEQKPPPAAPLPVIESKLRAVGLEDNANWEGLPELFAVWEGHAGWKEDKAQFAYWDQWSRSYSYFFEATRVNGKVTFRSIPLPDFFEISGSSFILAYASAPGIVWGTDTDLKTESPEHPFIFFKPVPLVTDGPLNPAAIQYLLRQVSSPAGKSRVSIDLKPDGLDLPNPTAKPNSSDAR